MLCAVNQTEPNQIHHFAGLQQRFPPLAENLVGFSLINDILIGWCHIHGFAHLLMEGQLAMVPPGELPQHIQRTSVRLAQAIRSHALASR